MRPRVFPNTVTNIMVKIKFVKKGMKAGSKKQQEPRLVGSIIGEMLQGWNRSTELCVDLKTILHSDSVMTTGKEYRGILRRDSDAEIEEFRCHDPHYTFVETKYITITRRDDGTLRPNFKPMKVGADFNLERFALGVYNELCMALYGLVEEA